MLQHSFKPRTTMVMRLDARSVAAEAPGYRRGTALVGSVLVLAGVLSAAAFVYQRAPASGGYPAEEGPPLRRVNITHPERPIEGKVVLPATLQPYQAADMYARTNGYLRAWKADIGDRVQAGQVLAVIDTPELDQELAQAEAYVEQGRSELEQARAELEEAEADVALAQANVEKAKAQLDFAASVVGRNDRLVRDRSIAPQDYDQSVRDREARKAEWAASIADARRRAKALGTHAAAIRSREAMIDSRQANVRRLRELQGFRTVVAPFDGVVTRRRAEVGSLVTAGSAGQPLFSVVQDRTLRVQLQVPQSYAGAVRNGDAATVIVSEYPNRPFTATVARTARGVDTDSRTVLVELELPNADGALLSGAYAQVQLAARRTDEALTLSSNTLMLRSDGPHVAVVNGGGTVRLQKVQLGRDYGNRVEVIGGLEGTEAVVMNPGDDLADGERVEVAVAEHQAHSK